MIFFQIFVEKVDLKIVFQNLLQSSISMFFTQISTIGGPLVNCNWVKIVILFMNDPLVVVIATIREKNTFPFM